MTNQNTQTTTQPTTFLPLIFGNGRLAKHLCHALTSHSIPFLLYTNTRHFESDANFWELYRRATFIWCLTPDFTLHDIFQTLNRGQTPIPFLHSSAATAISGASTLHPMMTFSEHLFRPEFYQQITWVRFESEPKVPMPFELFTHQIELPQEQRISYHAVCVMVSNFTQILLNAAITTVPQLKRQDYALLIRTAVDNFLNQGIDALTGPLRRKDQGTIEKHLHTLLGAQNSCSPRAELYQAFVKYYGETNL